MFVHNLDGIKALISSNLSVETVYQISIVNIIIPGSRKWKWAQQLF